MRQAQNHRFSQRDSPEPKDEEGRANKGETSVVGGERGQVDGRGGYSMTL